MDASPAGLTDSAGRDTQALEPQDLDSLTLTQIRQRLQQHARWKIHNAETAAVLLLRGRTHQQAREALGLTRAQYRHVKRWLREAISGDAYDQNSRSPGNPAGAFSTPDSTTRRNR